VKPADVRKHIASGETAPLYLLEGDDLQSRQELALEFESIVDEGLRAFNVQSFYANEATTAALRDQMVSELLSAARTLPMMVPRRILTVHEAERLLSPRKSKDEDQEPLPGLESSLKRKRGLTPLDELEQYLESPEPLTTLVFVAGSLDANRRLVKLVRKHAVAVDCGSLGDPDEAARWIKARVEREELRIEPQAVKVLLDATGLDLGRIRAEIDKLVLFVGGEPAITARHVREMVVPQSEPGEDFALGKAIWNSNARRALREVAAALDHGLQPFFVLGQVRAAAARLQPESRIKDALDLVFRTDLAIKSSTGEPRFLLERLVIELCTR
jgi:DNA polymerase III delta subunit